MLAQAMENIIGVFNLLKGHIINFVFCISFLVTLQVLTQQLMMEVATFQMIKTLWWPANVEL